MPKRRVIAYVALALALVVFLLAVSIHLTMPHYVLMAVRVFASEVTPWLVVNAILAGALAVASLDAGVIPRVALAMASAALVLAAIPLARVPAAIAATDRELDGALGAAVSERRAAFSLATTLLGLRAPEAAVDRDMEYQVNGATLRLDRYLPPTDGVGRPAIVVLHGGSWRGGDKGQSLTSTTEWSRILAASGFVVYDVQYRLAPAVRHPVPLEDVLCALAHVRGRAASDGVDPERVVLLGRSAGAHLALLAAYRASEAPCGPRATVRGVVALYGPTELVAAYEDPGDPDLIGARSIFRDFLGGTPDDLPGRYLDAMPRTWLDGAVPTLLVHGQADQIVSPRHSAELAARLRERGVPVAHVVLPWSGHSFDAISAGVGGQLALSAVERFALAVVRAP